MEDSKGKESCDWMGRGGDWGEGEGSGQWPVTGAWERGGEGGEGGDWGGGSFGKKRCAIATGHENKNRRLAHNYKRDSLNRESVRKWELASSVKKIFAPTRS